MSGCRAMCDDSCLYSQYAGGRGSLGYIVDFRPSWATERDRVSQNGQLKFDTRKCQQCTLQFHLHLKALLSQYSMTGAICDYLCKRPRSVGLVQISPQREGRAHKANKAVNGLPRRLPWRQCLHPALLWGCSINIDNCWGKSLFGAARHCTFRKSLIYAFSETPFKHIGSPR